MLKIFLLTVITVLVLESRSQLILSIHQFETRLRFKCLEWLGFATTFRQRDVVTCQIGRVTA